MTNRQLLGIAVGATLIAACAPTLQVKTDFDHAVAFGGFRTFQLADGRIFSKGVEVDSSLGKQRIDRAIRQQMAVEGLTPAAQNADLIVRYAAGVKSAREVDSFSNPMVAAPSADLWVASFPEGMLVIDLVDARTKKLVWRAYCRADGVGVGFDTQSFIDTSVAKAFEWYPPQRS